MTEDEFEAWQKCATAMHLEERTWNEYLNTTHLCYAHHYDSACEAIEAGSDFAERVTRLRQRVEEYCPFMNDIIGTGAMLSKDGDI